MKSSTREQLRIIDEGLLHIRKIREVLAEGGGLTNAEAVELLDLSETLMRTMSVYILAPVGSIQ